jgi:saccharopine dehydrogenase-like NADP-dependent oxidoreductase
VVKQVKVLFIGAGSVTSVAVNLLKREKKVSQIICADKNLRRAREFIDLHNGKIILKRVDASKTSEVAKLAKNVDVIVNASLPDFNLKIMSAALKVGADYQDLDSRLADLRHAEQLSFDRQFKKEGLVGLINAGISPGLTNLVVAECARRLNTLDSIKIRLLEDLKAKRFIFSWNPSVTIRELSSPVLIFSAGRFRIVKPFSSPEIYSFSQLAGRRQVYTIYGDEVATLPLYLNVKNVDYKSGGAEIENARALYQLGLFRRDRIKVDGTKISPFQMFCALVRESPSPQKTIDFIRRGIIEEGLLSIAVEVVGTKQRRKKIVRKDIISPSLTTITKKQPGATYISYPAGAATASFLLAIPHIQRKGVFPPEALSPQIRRRVLEQAKRYKIFVKTVR